MIKNKLRELYIHNKKICLSIIALLEAILIITAATFSWIEGTKDGYVKDTGSTVSAGAGLLFKTLDGAPLTKLELPEVKLEDCSSIDGRNFYFPISESEVSSTATSLKFRAGTDADVNTKYISQDFIVEALATSKIYIDGFSSVECDSNPEILKALRISLNFNDGKEPIVLCPGLISDPTVKTTSAVSSISQYGLATLQNTTAYAFNKYGFNTGNPVAVINSGETKRVTFTMWLEGTDIDCVLENIPSNTIKVNLILSTLENPTQEIKFIDYSPNSWVNDTADNKNINMYVIDESNEKRYIMSVDSDGITYRANIPINVEDVYFARFDPTDETLNYNSWAKGTTISRGNSRTYYAIGQGKEIDAVNYGYWVSDSCTGVVNVELTEAPLDNTLKFTNTNDWSNVYAYFFDSSKETDDKTVGNAWPGTKMTHFGTDSYSGTHGNYKVDIPAGADYVIFNNNDMSQTVNIEITDYESGYFINGKDGDYFTVGGWSVSRVDTTKQIFRTDVSPNIYFSSPTYNSVLNLGGVFNPNNAFNQSDNYGFNMSYIGQNSKGEYVYNMILPADATIRFNGNGNSSGLISLSNYVKNNDTKKIAFRFADATNFKHSIS